MSALAEIFGVRHFSPAGALMLHRFLEERRPKVVLIEGPSDASEQLKHLVHKGTRPPVAVLAFTKRRPVRSIIYPMAAYSPEWVALQWALRKKREVRFIDLPAAVFLELHRLEEERLQAEALKAAEAAATGGEDPARPAAGLAAAEVPPSRDDTQAYLDDPYQAIAELAGERDHETWWERQFEHVAEVPAYQQAMLEFGKGLRELREAAPAPSEWLAAARQTSYQAETLLREQYMRREIRAAGRRPEEAVVVCGAYHASALSDDLESMSDQELAALPRTDCVITLMPYSYLRLSAQSGYGAGNHAPAYFEALFEEGWAGVPERLPARYFSEIAGRLRREGLVRSAAEVIEAVRLAAGLAAINGSHAPALCDLRDAARTLLGQGELLPIEKALREVEIGSSIGTLPPGVSRTALQDDFHHLVRGLKLDQYLADKHQELELDLREDRFKKTRDAALLDRRRSTFLHRLRVLEISFGVPLRREQQGTAKERWALHWTPECEIWLAERSLQADSIELCAALALSQHLAEAQDVGQATEVLLRAAECELADALGMALRRVQELAVDDAAFASIGLGVENLSELIRYGSVREVDPEPLRPILAQLYLRGCLLFFGACVCDDEAARQLRQAVDRLHTVAFLGEEGIDPEPWLQAAKQVAESDSRNPFLSGYATALLIERGRLDDAAIDREVTRRLSPGADASLGVGWFEGLVQRNRAVLFLRRPLWASLSGYVESLDDEAFRRALLYLRRAFSGFDPGEVRRVVSLLSEVWGGEGGQALADAVERTLDEAEIEEASQELEGLDLL